MIALWRPDRRALGAILVRVVTVTIDGDFEMFQLFIFKIQYCKKAEDNVSEAVNDIGFRPFIEPLICVSIFREA